jgi:hypothetical protein
MIELLSGVISMAYLVAGAFFLRFGLRSKDVLFHYFAVAFWILAAQRIALSLAGEDYEHTTLFYVARLLAFMLILVGIWNKNRTSRAA